MNEILELLKHIAADAAVEVMRVYDRPFTVDFKAPNDPVTEADRRSNELICERLQKNFPQIPIVAEESPPEKWAEFREADQIFFVDPVDGTREFVAKNGQFVIMIGLASREGPTHGLLYAPARQTIWGGVVGEGAFRINPDGTQTTLSPLCSRPLHESRIVSSRSHPTKINQMVLDRLAPAEIIPLGSAGLKVAAVCDGDADIYLAPEFAGCRWDSCAPEALLRSLGGLFTDARGQVIDYRAPGVENSNGAVAAANGLHQQVIQALGDVLR